MDAETQRWIVGIFATLAFILIGAIFKMMWSEIKRLAKNVHSLLDSLQKISNKIAQLESSLKSFLRMKDK